MVRLLVVWFALCSVALGQLVSLATNQDGSDFRFVRRVALRTESAAATGPRVFRHGAEPQPLSYDLTSQVIASPIVSSDGLTTGIYTTTPCFGSCMIARPNHMVELARRGASARFYGYDLRVSRNGRFLFDSGFPSLHPGPYVLDLDTDQKVAMPNVLTRSVRNALTDDGALLSTEPGKMAGIGDPADYHRLLLTPFGGEPRTIYDGRRVSFASITPDGKSVVLVDERQLLRIDLATGQRTVLLEGWDFTIRQMEIDATASRVLLLLDKQLLLWQAATGWSSLYYHDEWLGEALLTDDGSRVFVNTRLNRFLSVPTDGGSATELYSPFPDVMRSTSIGTAPGSIVRFGTAVAPGLEYRIGGLRAPVVKIGADLLDLQIPWELDGSRGSTLEVSSPSSPFALRVEVGISPVLRPFLITDSGFLTAATADFGRLITQAEPAAAGSLIHFWVTGMGPLDRPVPTGEPGPSNPPSRPLLPLACYLNSPEPRVTVGLELPAVIYAPGLIGVYQVDAILPTSWLAGMSWVSCTSDNRLGTIANLPIG